MTETEVNQKDLTGLCVSFQSCDPQEEITRNSSLTKEQQKAVDVYFYGNKIFYGFTRKEAEDFFVWNNTLKAITNRSEEQEQMLRDSIKRLKIIFDYDENM